MSEHDLITSVLDEQAKPAILVVDDEPQIVEMLSQMLTTEGYIVYTSNDGSEALGTFQRHANIKLMVTDIRMPGMTGIELAEKVQQLQPDVRTLFISGYAEYDKIENVPIIHKPLDVSHFVRSVNMVMREFVDPRVQGFLDKLNAIEQAIAVIPSLERQIIANSNAIRKLYNEQKERLIGSAEHAAGIDRNQITVAQLETFSRILEQREYNWQKATLEYSQQSLKTLHDLTMTGLGKKFLIGALGFVIPTFMALLIWTIQIMEQHFLEWYVN